MTLKTFAVIDRDRLHYIHLTNHLIDEVVTDAELDGYAYDASCIAKEIANDYDWITVVVVNDGRAIKSIDFDRHHQGSIDVWYEDEISAAIA